MVHVPPVYRIRKAAMDDGRMLEAPDGKGTGRARELHSGFAGGRELVSQSVLSVRESMTDQASDRAL